VSYIREVNRPFSGEDKNVERLGVSKLRPSQQTPNRPTFVISAPSRGLFYEDGTKEFTVSPLTVGQLVSLSAVTKETDSSKIEKIICESVRESLHNFDVLDMTTGDFTFFLYWLRINSFQKNPWIISHVVNGEERQVIVDNTKMDVISLDEDRLPDTRFTYTRVRDNFKILEANNSDDEGLIYVTELASFYPGSDMKERLANLKKEDADIISDIRKFSREFYHGVNEYVTLPGEEAGKEVTLRLKLEMSGFFP